MGRRRFVLVDRDGTIIVERHYLSNPAGVELLPAAASGLRAMQALGLGLVIISNQSGVGRGFFDESRLTEIHQRMGTMLRDEGVVVDGIYFCPHVPENNCSCRKPRTGLAMRASLELIFDPVDSFVIGDKACDLYMGRALGATTFLVLTGYGRKTQSQDLLAADFMVESLADAARIMENLLRREEVAGDG